MKTIARFISYFTHPLFILTYGILFLLCADPFAFGVTHPFAKLPLLVLIIVYTVIFPLLTMLLMRLIGFIDGLEMSTKEERIGPLIATIVFYTWMYVNVRNNTEIPSVYSILCLGSIISLGLSFLINVFDKISLHMVGLSGLVTFVYILLAVFQYQWLQLGDISVQMILVLIGVLLITGVVGVSRVYLQAHSLSQILGGVLVGIIGQAIAWRFLL